MLHITGTDNVAIHERLGPLVVHALTTGVPDAVVIYNDMYALAILGALRARLRAKGSLSMNVQLGMRG
ncbi:MAG: hypothetical protein ACYCV7_07630 [Acidimicrobiales bacterium]